MFFNIPFATLSVLSLTASALGREMILERDGRGVFLSKRRFGQENPAVIGDVSKACGGGACGTISGSAISTLLAASPECAQQDKADEMIDLANTLTNANEKTALIAAAIKFRQAEKNTPPDFTTNPPTPRNSVFCQKAPKNAQLNGLVQAQDPANGDIFFDPATKASVKRGAQANTAPFGGKGGAAAPPAKADPPAKNGNGAAKTTAATPAKQTDAPAKNGNNNGNNAGNAGGDLQKFAAALGGVKAPAVTANGKQFAVAGNASFNSLQSALIRSCDVQNNKCADASNGAGNKKTFSVPDCNAQQTKCIDQARQS